MAWSPFSYLLLGAWRLFESDGGPKCSWSTSQSCTNPLGCQGTDRRVYHGQFIITEYWVFSHYRVCFAFSIPLTCPVAPSWNVLCFSDMFLHTMSFGLHNFIYLSINWWIHLLYRGLNSVILFLIWLLWHGLWGSFLFLLMTLFLPSMLTYWIGKIFVICFMVFILCNGSFAPWLWCYVISIQMFWVCFFL